MSGLIDLDVIAGAKATHKYARLSASKARVVLNLIRDEDLALARDRLRFCERGAAEVVSKVLESAVANATNNEQLDADELYVAECWADEGPVLKRWRPRARGRATRIFKQTSHITVIVAQLSPEELEMREARLAASGSQTAAAARAARVAASRATTDTGEADESAPDDADDIVATADEAAEAAIDDTGEAIAAEVDAADPEEDVADPEERN
ncbi:MAG: 50S ribosomal protein L22 [Acidimicrobiales bacterium]|uniref:50S ribosomal protein L22 n=1 Tax=Candidatus Poriferisodalis multihospitum TaxID=2983191 RepID=UPI00138270B1|nr:50S ribosomal protein L22 [Acidimicrobiales bacterium]MYD84097.1 50S ribosomal protein L22 [Acidimicrobiales bacterium]MYG62528.1 50S ribosomal protein L22 [Acidimicrobiales bacterium]MYJ66461.1 50S ribosomal protein L22 [Acidimicrobiales bacterium]